MISVRLFRSSLLIQSLWFRLREDFLKTWIVPQCIPLPALPQICKRDAIVGVIDSERCGEGALDSGDRLVGFAEPGANQGLEIFRYRSLNYVM